MAGFAETQAGVEDEVTRREHLILPTSIHSTGMKRAMTLIEGLMQRRLRGAGWIREKGTRVTPYSTLPMRLRFSRCFLDLVNHAGLRHFDATNINLIYYMNRNHLEAKDEES